MKNNGKGNPEPLPQSRKVVVEIMSTVPLVSDKSVFLHGVCESFLHIVLCVVKND
jgi:hypothetical protein